MHSKNLPLTFNNMQKFAKDSIGTKLEISFRTNENLSHIFNEIDIFLTEFEKKFSRFIEYNWLYNLNKTKSANLDNLSYKILKMMQKLSSETSWYFDPTIGKRLTELGYWNSDLDFGSEEFSHKNFDEIISLDEKKIQILWNYEIEFGWIGKWFLIDWIFNFLRQNLDKNTEFLINFSWDMACIGEWKVAIESPFADDEAIWIINLKNSFIACSAPTKRRFGKKSHHLINPFSRESASEIVTVCVETSIFTENAWMLTDGYATALCVMDFDFAKKKFLQNPYINGILVKNNWQFFQTPHSKIEIFK